MEYICIRCNYSTTKKSSFKNHINRKVVCVPTNYDTDISFYNELIDLDKTSYMSKLLKIQHGLLGCKSTNINHSGRDTNINSPTINIFNINDYNNTDYSFVEDGIDECQDPDGSLNTSKLLKLIHANKDHPENHNLIVSDRRNNTISILEDGIVKEFGKGKDVIKGIKNNMLKKVEKQGQLASDIIYEYNNISEDQSIQEETQEHNKLIHTIRNECCLTR